MNLTWNQVIDYFQTPDNMIKMIQNNEYVNEHVNNWSEWIISNKNQVADNYPELHELVSTHNCFFNIIYIIIMLWLLDNIAIKKRFNKARWFILHTIANILVIYYVWDDCKNMFIDPIKAFDRIPYYDALNITVALHFYHAMFFKNLTTIDWLHHVLMISIAIISYNCPSPVIITTNALLFFLNGLPGGVDYFLLTLLKYKIIRPIKEKELNSYLNIWIRSPGIIIGTHNMYLTTVYTNYNPNFLSKTIILCILIWNAQYFTYRVVGNYFTKLTKKCDAFEKREGRELSTDDVNVCVDNDKDMITEKDVVDELTDDEESTIYRLFENKGDKANQEFNDNDDNDDNNE